MPAGDPTFYDLGPQSADANRVEVYGRVLNTGTPKQMIQGIEEYYWNGTAMVPARTPIATATVTSVASSATNVTLLSSNLSRVFASIYNDSTANLYVKFGATASTTSFTVLLGQGDFYELPPRYAGQLDGIWASANGFARVTEV